MNIQRAFTFITDDPAWVTKLAILVGIALISPFLLGIPYLLVIGYSIQVAVNARKGVDNVLPEWDDWGQKFMDGLFIAAARFVYTLPIWIFFCLYLFVGGVMGAGSNADSDILGFILGGGFLVVTCLVMLFAIALIFINPGLIIQYIRLDTPSAMFDVKAVFGTVRDNMGDIAIMLAALIGAGIVIGFVGGLFNIIPILGQIIYFLITLATGPYLAVVSGHMIGQIAAKSS
jgi:hypothetical protein